MKKILFGAVAAMIALAACETIQPVEEHLERPQENVSAGRPSEAGPVSDSVLFTASLGVQSKTYLDYDGNKYKTLWDATDKILVWDADCFATDNYDGCYEFCNLKSGAGTTQATFAGTLEADSYVALYASQYYMPINGYPAINLPVSQYVSDVDGETNIAPYIWPMIAFSDNKDLEFQNLCSILKVSLTGNGENLRTVTVSAANGEPMSGVAIVYGNENSFEFQFIEDPDDDSVYSWVDYYHSAELSDDPVDCYIVIPAQTYEGGLDVTIVTDQGYMSVSTTNPVTTLRSRFYDMSIEYASDEVLEEETISYMLGNYTIYAESFYNGECSWTLKINETNEYAHTVWFSNLCKDFDSQETRFYGIVSEDKKTITIPFGQETEWHWENGYPITLYGYDGENVITSGALEISIYGDTRSMTLDFEEGIGLAFYIHGEDGGYVDVLLPGIFAVKN